METTKSETSALVSVKVHCKYDIMNESSTLPCLLPPIDCIDSIEIDDNRHYRYAFDTARFKVNDDGDYSVPVQMLGSGKYSVSIRHDVDKRLISLWMARATQRCHASPSYMTVGDVICPYAGLDARTVVQSLLSSPPTISRAVLDMCVLYNVGLSTFIDILKQVAEHPDTMHRVLSERMCALDKAGHDDTNFVNWLMTAFVKYNI